MKSFRVATCQFSVEGRIEHNRRWVLKQIAQAAEQQADVVHSPVCVVRYADRSARIADLDWDALAAATRDVMSAAKEHRVWVLLVRRIGSTKNTNRTTACTSSIRKARSSIVTTNASARERMVRKRRSTCVTTRPAIGRPRQSQGDHLRSPIFYDYRFPELYRATTARRRGHVFSRFTMLARQSPADPKYNIWKTIGPRDEAIRAAENHFCSARTTAPLDLPAGGASRFVPDGLIVGRLPRHRPGVLVTDMKLDPECFDAPALWRPTGHERQLHSGHVIEHRALGRDVSV